MNRQELGRRSEDLAVLHLRRQRHKIIGRNVSSAHGEIDIVSLHRKTVVFTEVRAKSSIHYGRPEETIDRRKQERIKKTAEYYLYCRGWQDQAVRFDVISLVWSGEDYSLEYYEDAFR